MPHVFISYVKEDNAAVDHLCEELTAYGIPFWRDKKDINPGERWKRTLKRAIDGGDFFIACFSDAYWRRNETFMNQELRWALEQMRFHPLDRVWFIPVLLSECKIPDYVVDGLETLQDFQYVELYKGWNEGVRRIIRVIDPDGARVRELIAVLEDVEAPIVDRINAADQLGKAGTLAEATQEPLSKALFDSNSTLRATAVLSLSRASSLTDRTLTALILGLKDTDKDVKARTRSVLRRVGKPAVRVATALLESGDSEQRLLATVALTYLAEQAIDSIPQLLHALTDDDDTLHQLAAWALARIGDAAESHLLAALVSPDTRVRCRAAQALGYRATHTEEARNALLKLMSDEDGMVRAFAADALLARGENRGEAVRVLLGLLQQREDAASSAKARHVFTQRVASLAGYESVFAEALESHQSLARIASGHTTVIVDLLRSIGSPEAKAVLKARGYQA